MRISVIIPAAGLGKRFNGGSGGTGGEVARNKIELDLGGRPVFLRSIELFLNRPIVGQILLAVNPDTLDEFRFRWGDKLAFHGVTVIAGGRVERWETVLNALAAVDANATHIAVHDAARPLTSAKVIDRVFEAAGKYPAVIPAIPVCATLKKVAAVDPSADAADPLDAILGSAGKEAIQVQKVVGTVDRRTLVEVQTPQVFEVNLLRKAYAQITAGKIGGKAGGKSGGGEPITDDAGLVEALGQSVMTVEGESTNFKITRPEDLVLARAFAAATDQKNAASLAKRRLFADQED